jgi:hypothetical protein
MMTKNYKKFKDGKKLYFLISKTAIDLSLGQIKDVIGEAFSPKKRTPSTLKLKISLFSNFVGHFCPTGSGSGSSRTKSKINVDPCGSGY